LTVPKGASIIERARRPKMTVGRRMTPNPIAIKKDFPVSEAQNKMRKEYVHRFPIVDDHGKLVGIVTEKDLLYASPSPATTLDVYEMSYLLSKLTVEKVMTSEVISINVDDPIEEAARVMSDNNIGGLPVLGDGKLVGIITESDVFKAFIEMFGARESGIRISMLVPQKPGELADLTSAIFHAGGNILGLGNFLGEDSSEVYMTLKVENLTSAALKKAVEPFVDQILDIREVL
jgi:acetoin utilization protein AcuB